MKKIILAYVPVLHEGYRLFFEENKETNEVYLLDKGFLIQFSKLNYIKKDIRALDSNLVAAALKKWGIKATIKTVKQTIDMPDFETLKEEGTKIILGNDDIGRFLQTKYLEDWNKEQLKVAPVFLRWDKNLAKKKVEFNPRVKISREAFEQEAMKLAFRETEKSADWWRRVGTVIMRDGEVLLAGFNRHLPHNDQPYRSGDPRSCFSSGIDIEMASSIHAEAAVIASAAKRGIKLEGASIFVSTFPCPVCAKQIAYSGIKKLYYAKGYTLLDGLDILKAFDVEIIQVLFDEDDWEEVTKNEEESVHVKEYCC